MKFVIICISLSLLFSVTTAAKAWDSPLFSMQEEFEKNFDDKRNNLRSRESYLERTEEDLLKEEEALLESIVERYGHSDGDDDDHIFKPIFYDDDDDKYGDDDDDKDGDDDDDDDTDNKIKDYEGCYRDGQYDRNLDQKVNTDGFLTVNKCIDKCKDEKYKLAGVAKSGGECWCGSRNNNRKTYDSSDCKFIKDRGGYAGGDTVISVYKVDKRKVVNDDDDDDDDDSPVFSPIFSGDDDDDDDDDDTQNKPKDDDDDDDDNDYEGCYRDGKNDRNLNRKVNTDGFLTVNKCIDKCKDDNYDLAGVAKSGGECWCGSRNNNRKTYDSSDCEFIKDRGGYAGGDTVISVYKVQYWT